MKITIILHGPFFDNAYDKIISTLKYIPKQYSNCIKIFIVSYETDYEQTKKKFKTLSVPIKIISCKDIINPGFFNINRQIFSVNHGLEETEEDSFIIKLRNDMWISWKKLFSILEKEEFFSNVPEKILTTNCFTRKDRLYHPSDLFLCGWKKTIAEYYSCPMTGLTQISWQLKLLKKVQTTNLPFNQIMFSPESELFCHYLKLKQWNFKNTIEDSYNAIKKYCYMINTWDIDLRWNKKRNANLPKGTIILPYKFSMEPFAGVPKENAECYARHDFYGRKTLRDFIFIHFANYIFNRMYNKKSITQEIKKFIKKIFHRFPKFFKIPAKRCYKALRCIIYG